jgi:hypothetical protein
MVAKSFHALNRGCHRSIAKVIACASPTAASSLRYSPNGYLNPPTASFTILCRDEHLGATE